MRNRNGRDRRRLELKRETLRKLLPAELGRVAGGTSFGCESMPCWDTADCDTAWLGTGSRFC